MVKKVLKEYAVIYRSEEHYEVLGFVNADSLSEAESKAQEQLLKEAKYYNVAEAEIVELKKPKRILFNISQ